MTPQRRILPRQNLVRGISRQTRTIPTTTSPQPNIQTQNLLYKSQINLNKYLNNPNYDIIRNSQGIITKITAKPVQYTTYKTKDGDKRINYYIPETIIFTNSGIPIQQYTTYPYVKDQTTNTKTYGLYNPLSITFDSEGFRKTLTKSDAERKSTKDSERRIVTEEVRKYDKESYKTQYYAKPDIYSQPKLIPQKPTNVYVKDSDGNRVLGVTTPTADGGTVTVSRTGKVTIRNSKGKIIPDGQYYTTPAETKSYLSEQSKRIISESAMNKKVKDNYTRLKEIFEKQGYIVEKQQENLVAMKGNQKIIVKTDTLNYVQTPKSAKISPSVFTYQERLSKKRGIDYKKLNYLQLQTADIFAKMKGKNNISVDKYGNLVVTDSRRKIIIDKQGNYLDLPLSAKVISNVATDIGSKISKNVSAQKFLNKLYTTPELQKSSSIFKAVYGLFDKSVESKDYITLLYGLYIITNNRKNELIKQYQNIDRAEILKQEGIKKGIEGALQRSEIIKQEQFIKANNLFKEGKLIKYSLNKLPISALLGVGTGLLEIAYFGKKALTQPIELTKSVINSIKDWKGTLKGIRDEFIIDPTGTTAKFITWNYVLNGAFRIVEKTPKLLPKYVPSFKNLKITRLELQEGLKRVRLAKPLVKKGIKLGTKIEKAKNTLLLSKLNKLESSLVKGIKNLKKIEKNPKVLKLEDINPLIETEKLIKEIGKTKQVFHATTTKVSDLFGKKQLFKEIKKTITNTTKIIPPKELSAFSKLSKIQKIQVYSKYFLDNFGLILKPSTLKEVILNIIKNKNIFRELGKPKIMTIIKSSKQSAGIKRFNLGERYLFLDFEVPTYYAMKEIYKNYLSKIIEKTNLKSKIKNLDISAKRKMSLLKAINSTENYWQNSSIRNIINSYTTDIFNYVTMRKQWTVIRLKTKIQGFPKPLMNQIKKTIKGELSSKQITKLRKDLASWTNNNPNKLFLGGRTSAGTDLVRGVRGGEREVVLGVGTKLILKQKKFSIDPSTNIFFNIAEVTLKSNPKKYLTLTQRFNKALLDLKNLKTKNIIKDIQLRLSKQDISKMKYYQNLINKGKKISLKQEKYLKKFINNTTNKINKDVKILNNIPKNKIIKRKLNILRKTTLRPIVSRYFLTTRTPTTRTPTTRKPTTRTPTTRTPTTRKPTTRKPTARTPTTRKPTTRKPTARTPTTRKPTARTPTARTPTARTPTARTPTTRTPTTRTPTARTPTTRTPPPRKPPIPPPTKLNFDELAKNKPIDVYVKRQGARSRYTKINSRPLSLNSAKNYGRYIVDNLPLASYKLVISKSRAKTMKFTTKTPSQKFRERKGKTKLPSKTMVEKSKYRLDKNPEKKGITLKGLQKLQSERAIINAIKKVGKRKTKKR